MASIKASIGTVPYLIEIKSPSGNTVLADEPIEKGGQDKGFSPKELLASSLGACTCATVRMYAERKSWPLAEIKVDVELIDGEGETKFSRKIELLGDLDEQQRTRILNVANACPIHKILTHTMVVETVLV